MSEYPTIRNISLDANGFPTTVTIKMTVAQLADIAKLTGKLSPATGATEHTSAIYSCAVGELFNRFWEDGVDGYLRGEEAR